MSLRSRDELLLHIEPGDEDEKRDLELAKAVAIALNDEYPNHYWLVGFQNHNLVVRHVAIANAVAFATGREGFCTRLPREKIATIHEAVASAKRHAGALLEAFKLKRGAWDGETEPTVPQDLKDAIWRGQAHRIAQILGAING
jgi:hypothetical protein